ncbi:DEAD/DEAH box helicase [candidate division KSB1 bacterium]|nr:DEAD/DEAH box helicase [candidate division KSB1 bacterium]
MQILFDRGTIVIKNLPPGLEPENCAWDNRTNNWRARGMYYSDVIRWLDFKEFSYKDQVPRFIKLNAKLNFDYNLHYYQKEGLNAWIDAKFRGCVILPTGSGKSFLAIKAIQKVNASTLIILPTLDLMNQWYDLVSEVFNQEIGILGGGYHQIEDITVTTYDSALNHADVYGDRFSLLIFDEVHHLPAEHYSQIAEMCIAPHRLGLTATYYRMDGYHGKLDRLIGPVVYKKDIHDLKGSHLSDFEIERIKVDLTPREKLEYDKNELIYEDFIKETGYKFHGPDLEKFLAEVNLKPNARKALLAKFKMKTIILNAARKLDVLESLLKLHAKDRIIIFTENNELVYSISCEFLIPALTHQTKTIERKQILKKFRNGEYSVLVTSKVLNEGVDVPEANVAIILSGSSSPREYLQRLGRILRKREDKQAVLYEIVTKGTREVQVSYRRRKSHAS